MHGGEISGAPLAHLPSLRVLNISGNHALDLAPIAVHGAIANLRVGGLGTSLRPLAGLRCVRPRSRSPNASSTSM